MNTKKDILKNVSIQITAGPPQKILWKSMGTNILQNILNATETKKKLLEHIEVENMIEVLLSQKHY